MDDGEATKSQTRRLLGQMLEQVYPVLVSEVKRPITRGDGGGDASGRPLLQYYASTASGSSA